MKTTITPEEAEEVVELWDQYERAHKRGMAAMARGDVNAWFREIGEEAAAIMRIKTIYGISDNISMPK